MRLQTNDAQPLRGDLRIRVRSATTGEVIQRIEIRNTIMNLGLGALVHLLSQKAGGPAAATLQLGYIHVGTDTTPATRTQTGILGPLTPDVKLELLDANKFPNTGSAPYELAVVATLGALQGNGETLCEAGLLLADGTTLFARQTHPAITKSEAILIDYDWRIAFTA